MYDKFNYGIDRDYYLGILASYGGMLVHLFTRF